jgi:hypothetical protein
MPITIKSERIKGSPVKIYTDGGKLYYNVVIYLNGTNEDLDDIVFVEYELHPTFKNRIKTSSDRDSNFSIEIWTYGFFNVKATIKTYDKKAKPIVISGKVKWEV